LFYVIYFCVKKKCWPSSD